MGNKFTWLIVVILLGILSLGYLYIKDKNQATAPQSTRQTLRANSENYNSANDLYTQRQYGKAIEKYNAAINDTDSLTQEALIKSRIAWATAYEGDNLKAIELFKEIIDDPKYATDSEEIKRGKATAVVALSSIFYQTHDKKITEKIFSGKPYEDFIKKEDDSDISIAYRRLMEYASSLSSSPNLLAEGRIALWYGIKIYQLNKKKIISETEKKQIQEYKEIIKLKLAYIDKNSGYDRNYYDNSRSTVIPVLLRFKAIAMGSLTIVGDTSMGDPEKIFQEALALPQPEWTTSQTRYSYAVFLAATYGSKRKEDIANLLSDFYTPSTGTEFSWRTWLLNEKNNPTRSEDVIPLLASIDPKFKALVVSLGWKF